MAVHSAKPKRHKSLGLQIISVVTQPRDPEPLKKWTETCNTCCLVIYHMAVLPSVTYHIAVLS